MSQELRDFSLASFSLKGKVAMVTGANQGLGMAYAVAFAKAGADLFIPHFTEDVSEIKQLIEETGQKVAFLQGDLTNELYIEDVVQACLKEYGSVDILVNNPGAAQLDDFVDYPDTAWQKIMDINLNAIYYLSHRVGALCSI